MSLNDGKYDNMLFEVLQNEGQINTFLETVFSFLYRRTDYYRIHSEENKSLGFPPNVAENILRQIFVKYYNMARRDDERQQQMNVPDIASEVVVPVENDSEKEILKAKRRGKIIERTLPQNSSSDGDCYNGANLDAYSWSQNQRDIDVRVKVPKELKSGKNVKVDVRPDRMVVSILEQQNDAEPVWNVKVEGNFSYKVLSDSIWTLVPGDHIHINLEKAEERLWENLLEGEPKLDTRQMDNTLPVEHLDEDSQAVVQELMYNQNQKMMGKLTSKEQKMEKILKEAWDMEGSPFQGQPFDMSKVNMSNPEGLSRDFDL